MSSAVARNVLRKSPLIIRMAGLSGALAVSLEAYGAHGLRLLEGINDKRLRSYDQAARYHLLHSFALLGAPMARFPTLTASLFIVGMAMFCGNCYYFGYSGDNQYVKYTPFGGMLIIVAWLSFVL